MRLTTLSIVVVVAVAAAVSVPSVANAQTSPFVGSWNLNGTGSDTAFVYWLEIKDEGGTLKGSFLDRVSSPANVAARVENGELIFQRVNATGQLTGVEYRARLEGGRMIGQHTVRSGGRGGATPTERVVNWAGAKRPAFPASNANAAHKYGTPVVLFAGSTIDALGMQHADRPLNWAVTDGLLVNTPPSNNLVSKQKFGDFKVELEYRLTQTNSNSGLYLRGRYELQLLDDFGKPLSINGHASVYGRVTPLVNASKPVGEWQQLTAILVGNRVTVMLNGQKLHDNVAIDGVTGGALDNDELTPGPIMIQGDHSQIAIRKLTVTPIVK